MPQLLKDGGALTQMPRKKELQNKQQHKGPRSKGRVIIFEFLACVSNLNEP